MGASVRPQAPDPVAEYLAAKQAQSTAKPGSDPVADYLTAKQAATSPASTEGPGVFSRALGNIGNAIMHPIDTAESILSAPIKSAFDAAISPGVGEPRTDARLSKGGNSSGRPIDTSPYDAAHGAVTPGQRMIAAVQTAANVAFPAVAKGTTAALESVPGLGRVATAGGLATAGAMTGAAYDPNDPLGGAVTGAIATPVLGAAARGVGKVADLGGKLRRVSQAAPLDQTIVDRGNAMQAADEVNYGRAADEAKANGGTSTALQDALDHERVRPYVNQVRGSALGENADDATVAAETYKLMTQHRKGLQARMDREGFNADAALEIQNLRQAQKVLKAATAAPGEKPAITMSIAPEVTEADPQITPGRDAMLGPMSRGRPAEILPGHEAATGPVSEQPLSAYTTPPNPTLSQALRNFQGGTENAVQGPGGPTFQMRAQPDQVIREAVPSRPAFQLGADPGKVVPGVRIETPAMRIQTAPPEAEPPLMPSFPEAVAEHARQAQALKALTTAANQTKRIMTGTSMDARRMGTQSPAAWRDQIAELTPDQAQAALEGLLGRAKEQTTIHAPTTHATLFGTVANVAKPFVRMNRIAPYIDALDTQAGMGKAPISYDALYRMLGLIPATDSKTP